VVLGEFYLHKDDIDETFQQNPSKK
jgi:hypothetical protein